MPHPWQRAEIGKVRYAAGSAIAVRNQRLALAKRIGAVKQGHAGTDRLVSRLTTAADMACAGSATTAQIDIGREPFLLVEDVYNDCQFLPVAVYDHMPGQEQRSGMVVLDVHQGVILVPGSTLIYWK